MTKATLKTRITLFTAILLALLLALSALFLYLISNHMIRENGLDRLVSTVASNADQLANDGDMADVEFIVDDVYTLVYTDDGHYVQGSNPHGFYTDAPLHHGATQTIAADMQDYYVYDMRVPVDGGGVFWLRGIVTAGTMLRVVQSAFLVAAFVFPLLLIIGSIGCYRITKKALMPLHGIMESAKTISNGANLAKRMDVRTGAAEVVQLSETFDAMFARLESAFEAEKQFSADVSHELRTPVGVVRAQCEYALFEETTDEQKTQSLEVIYRQNNRMARIIAALLDLSRLERGVDKACFAKEDVSELINDVCDEQCMIMPDKMRLHRNIADSLVAYVDKDMLSRLLTNLVRNAIAYGKADGNIKVSLYEESADFFAIEVEDDGMGIAKKHLPFLFQRFYQVDQARSTSKSLGLGLSMVAEIARAHGGNVQVFSDEGQGSLFKIKIPFKHSSSFNEE